MLCGAGTSTTSRVHMPGYVTTAKYTVGIFETPNNHMSSTDTKLSRSQYTPTSRDTSKSSRTRGGQSADSVISTAGRAGPFW